MLEREFETSAFFVCVCGGAGGGGGAKLFLKCTIMESERVYKHAAYLRISLFSPSATKRIINTTNDTTEAELSLNTELNSAPLISITTDICQCLKRVSSIRKVFYR